MSTAMVVTMVNGTKRTFPGDTYTQFEDGVLTLKDTYSKPTWWICFTLRNVISWGPEEVEQ